MSALDEALKNLQENPQDQDTRHAFYDLFLNSVFYVPTYDQEIQGIAKQSKGEDTLPLIMQIEGVHYMLLFDTQERLNAWAEDEVHCLVLPGYLVAQMSSEDLHWVLNAHTDFQKQFVPEEIAWLKEVVRNAKKPGDEAGADD